MSNILYAASKKQIVCEDTPCLYQTPAKPVFAWGPDVSVEDSGDYLNRGNLQMHGSHLSKGPISLNIPTDNTSGEGSISELDGCIQGVRLLCMAGVPKNSKESLLNKILELSSCIDEKYAIIDVSGLIEDNKVGIAWLYASSNRQSRSICLPSFSLNHLAASYRIHVLRLSKIIYLKCIICKWLRNVRKIIQCKGKGIL